MSYDSEDLTRIYYRTNGKCHICGKKLSLTNYGRVNSKGAWEVEHSVPRSEGGTAHLNNLFPACVACNRLKGTQSSRTARSWNDRTKAPLSKERRLAAS
jgi:5-methylcytosine-specific restriction endonuclease McrA